MLQIEELATSTRAPAPGWSYVVETGPRYDPSKAAINPTAQKRRRVTGSAGGAALYADESVNTSDTTTGLWGSGGGGNGQPGGYNGFGRELTLRQQAEIKRHLADLERDSGHKDASSITIPKSIRPEGDGRRQGTNVRKILGSGKTFAHYLEEEEAAARLQSTSGARAQRDAAAAAGTPTAAKEQRASKLPYARRKSGAAGAADGNVSGSSNSTPAPSTSRLAKQGSKSATPPAASATAPATTTAATPAPPTFAPGTILAPPPAVTITEEEIEALLSAPPLGYNESRSRPPEEWVGGGGGGGGGGARRKHRVFCEICGYWGRVRCGKCGARVCGIECRDAHESSGACLRFYA